jgi:hypothetical protein
LSSSCSNCANYDFATYGDVQGAYNVYQNVGPLTPTELLAAIIAPEFTALLKQNDPDGYALGLEALARQFYSMCPGGTCYGDALWIFLGGFEAWYTGSSAAHYRSGNHVQFLEDAEAILNNQAWRSGAASNRPWTWGNRNQMFTEHEIDISRDNYSFTVDHGNFTQTYTMGYMGISDVVNANNPLVILSHHQQLARHYYRQNYPGCGQGGPPCILP